MYFSILNSLGTCRVEGALVMYDFSISRVGVQARKNQKPWCSASLQRDQAHLLRISLARHCSYASARTVARGRLLPIFFQPRELDVETLRNAP